MEWLDENKDRTFFLLIHTCEPHAPFCDDYFVRHETVDPSLKDTARYDGDIRRADLFIGKLVEKLDQLNSKSYSPGNHLRSWRRSNWETLLKVCASWTRARTSLYDDVLLVPLIFYNPNVFSNAKSIAYQVRSIDVLPTMLEYLGCPAEPS
jgi:arylsulfatase A-like enzyme